MNVVNFTFAFFFESHLAFQNSTCFFCVYFLFLEIGLEKSEKSDLNILVNYDVLTTGFDAPKTKIAIITRPTTSIVLYHQMIGRAVRGKKANGNKSCKILTVADTYLPGYKDLADSFYFWEDIWND